jgi:hypothetical protein
MTGDTPKGRSVETVQAELRALESRSSAAIDPALRVHVDHLRREHEEARRARQRQVEDDLMTLPPRARPT